MKEWDTLNTCPSPLVLFVAPKQSEFAQPELDIGTNCSLWQKQDGHTRKDKCSVDANVGHSIANMSTSTESTASVSFFLKSLRYLSPSGNIVMVRCARWWCAGKNIAALWWTWLLDDATLDWVGLVWWAQASLHNHKLSEDGSFAVLLTRLQRNSQRTAGHARTKLQAVSGVQLRNGSISQKSGMFSLSCCFTSANCYYIISPPLVAFSSICYTRLHIFRLTKL